MKEERREGGREGGSWPHRVGRKGGDRRGREKWEVQYVNTWLVSLL